MGAYDGNRRGEVPYGRELRVGSGEADVRPLSDRFADLAVSGGSSSSSRDHLVQVIKAVEDAEVTINQQMEENNQLRDALLRKTQELEHYKSVHTSLRPSADLGKDEQNICSYAAQLSNSPAENERGRIQSVGNGSTVDSPSTLIVQHGPYAHCSNSPAENERGRIQSVGNGSTVDSRATLIVQHGPYASEDTSGPGMGNNQMNGNLQRLPGTQSSIDNVGPSQFPSQSSRSLSPERQQKLAEYESRINSSNQGYLPASDVNSNILWKKELVIKIREHEEEIIQLRKHLSDYSVKEAQIQNEKYVLEKRIAYMRLAFDQQQQDLVDAASKALSYRQDIIEENIRLTYALQSAQQEKATFVSSLLPLLSEYSLKPAVLDAQSIVSNLKIIFRHLQEKLIITEEKLKESQYQLVPWNLELANTSNLSPQSPSHALRGTRASPNNNGLEIVAQTLYSHTQSPISSPSNAPVRGDWETSGNQIHQAAPGGVIVKAPEHESAERNFPSVSRTPVTHEAAPPIYHADHNVMHYGVDSRNQSPIYKNFVEGQTTDDSESAAAPHARDNTSHWAAGSSSYMQTALDDQNSSYPYLPPVKEEPGSSFSEAGEEDPLPAIDGLQISGDAFPGRELKAAGYSINGTTTCNFEWVRYLEDGSVNYIDGAKQPRYLVTADDVDSYLAIEVQPLDNRKRKGELVKVFANELRKIVCDPEMQEQIERAYSVGHVSFEVSLSAGALDIWEHATLAIKREGYSIKCNGPRGVVVIEKFLPTTNITIPYGHPSEFIIHCADDAEYLLRATDTISCRDTIVLTMRLFKMRAVEKRKGKKRGLFFK